MRHLIQLQGIKCLVTYLLHGIKLLVVITNMIKFYNQEETPAETPETPVETPAEEGEKTE